MSAVVHSARDHASTNGRPTAPARASSHCGRTTVPAGGRSLEKLEVVQPREDELAREGIKRPETGADVHVDLEAGRFLKFFSNALNQLDEAAPVISQSRMSVKIWRHAGHCEQGCRGACATRARPARR